MPTMKQMKWERAKKYVLEHPDQSKEEQATACEVSESTIATVRAALVRDGLLHPSRKARQAGFPPPRTLDDIPSTESSVVSGPSEASKPSSRSGVLLDDAAMRAITEGNSLLDENLSDDEIIKRLLRQNLAFAGSPHLHPDTRMSASQQWAKLRDLAKEKNLGAGKPLTFEDAVTRLGDMMLACGADITLAALRKTYQIAEVPDANPLPPQHAEAPSPSAGASPAPGSEAPVPPDAGAAGPQQLG